MSEQKNNRPANAESKIRELMLKLQIANTQVEDQPLKACEVFTKIIAEANGIANDIPEAALTVLQNIQETAGDNLVQAALMATNPSEVDVVVPMLSGKMGRLNNILNLGFYLHENKISVDIDKQNYTATYCAKIAEQIAPNNEITQRLIKIVKAE